LREEVDEPDLSAEVFGVRERLMHKELEERRHRLDMDVLHLLGARVLGEAHVSLRREVRSRDARGLAVRNPSGKDLNLARDVGGVRKQFEPLEFHRTRECQQEFLRVAGKSPGNPTRRVWRRVMQVARGAT
jgi:hypothetical protein